MMWQPIAPVWVLLLVAILPLGFAIWRSIAEWHTPHRWAWLRRAIIVLLILVISFRPSVPGASHTSGNALLDVYFVVDSSLSSSAEDFGDSQTRLDGIRQDTKDIATALVGARFSVITFGNTARTILPLTTDTSAVGAAVDTTIPESPYYASGSSIDRPIDELQASLTTSKKQSPDRGRIVFYMGDGEQTATATPKSFAALAPLISGGGVLGYGTTAGGRMREPDYYSNLQSSIYVKDYTSSSYADALSKIDESRLQTIASQLGVQYSHRTGPGDIEQLLKDVNITYVLQHSRDRPVLNDLYWLLAIPLAALVGYETWLIYVQARQLRKLHKRGLL